MDVCTVAFNLKGTAPSMYNNYDFWDYAMFKDMVLGGKEDGIFVLEDEEVGKDDGDNIVADVRLLETDFGDNKPKSIWRVLIGGESDGALLLTLFADEYRQESASVYIKLETDSSRGMVSRNVKLGKGRYWWLEITNVDGCDFQLDAVDVELIVSSVKQVDRSRHCKGSVKFDFGLDDYSYFAEFTVEGSVGLHEFEEFDIEGFTGAKVNVDFPDIILEGVV